MSEIVIFSRLQAQPGRGAELTAAFDDLNDAVAGEPGTITFTMHVARDDPDALLFYEVYADGDALTAHRESDAVRAVVPRLDGLLANHPEITYAQAIRAKKR